MKQYEDIIRETLRHNELVSKPSEPYEYDLKRNNEMQKKAKLYETIR